MSTAMFYTHHKHYLYLMMGTSKYTPPNLQYIPQTTNMETLYLFYYSKVPSYFSSVNKVKVNKPTPTCPFSRNSCHRYAIQKSQSNNTTFSSF